MDQEVIGLWEEGGERGWEHPGVGLGESGAGWDQTLPLLFHSEVEKRPLGPFKPHSGGPEG